MSIRYKIAVTALLTVLAATAIFAQQSITLTSYNLLNYANDSNREGYYRTIMNEVNPDLLVVQEIAAPSGVDNFLNHVLNFTGNEYSAGDFVDGPDTDNAIFYRTDLFDFISNSPISTSLRDINGFKLVYLATNDTLTVYSVHLKASQGGTNEQKRFNEVSNLLQVTANLSTGTNYIICGDFNIYYSDESAFQALLDQSNPGYFIDPIHLPGHWHNNASFAPYHTQSPRVRQFGGGSTGGIDDRFDMILISPAVSDSGGIRYIDDSYLSFGNDGLHFNDSINAMPNLAVSENVANALHYASDHLPVICRLAFESVIAIKAGNSYPKDFAVSQYPNPFNSTTTIEISAPKIDEAEISVYNIRGQVLRREKLKLNPGQNAYRLNASDLPSGIYFCRVVTQSGFVASRKIILQK